MSSARPKSSKNAPEVIDVDRLFLVVVGAHPKAELNDRPTAYLLRQRIRRWLADRAAAGDMVDPQAAAAERAGVLVVTDVWYLNDESMRQCPTICIGGPGVNALAAYLGDKLPSAFVVDGMLMVQMDLDLADLTACCWGVQPEATSAAVDAFCQKYLEEFLGAALRRMSTL